MRVCRIAPLFPNRVQEYTMELTDTEIHLLARLSRDRRLYAECKGADLDALQKLGRPC
jgi:hypothetical protein